MSLRLLTITLATISLAAAVPAAAEDEVWHDRQDREAFSDRTPPLTPAPQAPAVATRQTQPLSPARSTASSSAYDHLIQRHAERHGLSPELIKAIIRAESAFNPYAISHKGAMGLMQLMPATADDYGVLNPFDPEENIAAGVAYFRRLLDRYDGKLDLALAAYNAGPTTVDRYGKTVPPYRETQTYVRKIVSVTPISVGPSKTIYKIVELIDGREVPRYSDRRPAGDYEVVTRR